MTDLDMRARLAGGLYLLTFPLGVFSLIYAPSQFIVSGNPAATIANIVADQTLFRLGVFGEVMGAALWWGSGFMPRALAVLQAVAVLAYMVSATTGLLEPSLDRQIDTVTGLASFLGETPAILWLLIMGARVRAAPFGPSAAQAAPV